MGREHTHEKKRYLSCDLILVYYWNHAGEVQLFTREEVGMFTYKAKKKKSIYYLLTNYKTEFYEFFTENQKNFLGGMPSNRKFPKAYYQ